MITTTTTTIKAVELKTGDTFTIKENTYIVVTPYSENTYYGFAPKGTLYKNALQAKPISGPVFEKNQELIKRLGTQAISNLVTIPKSMKVNLIK